MRVLLCRRPVSWESHPNLSVKRSKGLRERDLPQTLLAVFIRRTRRSEERNLLMERVYYSGACLKMKINTVKGIGVQADGHGVFISRRQKLPTEPYPPVPSLIQDS